jgi:hypothetical protein
MKLSQRPFPTTTTEEHEYCKQTGFCVRCGSHEEYNRFNDMLCVFSDNTFAISHVRAKQIMDEKIRRISNAIVEG